MSAIFKKEFKSYFINMSGYVFMAFLLLFAGIYVTAVNLKGGYAAFEITLSSMSMVFLFVIPILTMRSIAEERHSRTDQLLYSLPLQVSDIVLGKFFAMLAVLLIPVAIMSVYPLILSVFGSVNFAASYGALLAFFLLGGALIAICMFMSALTESQIIAAVLSFGVLLAAYLMSGIATLIPTTAMASFICLIVVSLLLAAAVWGLTRNPVIAVIAAAVCILPLSALYYFRSELFVGLFQKVLDVVSLFTRFENFIYGIFDVGAIVYYLSVTALFLFLTAQSVEKRRWS